MPAACATKSRASTIAWPKPAWAIGAKALKILALRKVTAETTHERRCDIDFSTNHCITWRGQAPVWAA